MATKKQVLTAAAAVAGVGAAVVVVPADPARAHETTVPFMRGDATVGAGHAGIRVCDRDPEVRVYEARWITFTGDRKALVAPINGGCNDYVDPDGIARYRMCALGYGCTGWKET